MKPAQVYDGCIRFEERSAEIYMELSIRFLHEPDLAWFWVEMAMEEKQHAGLLQFCRETGICGSRLPGREQMINLKTLFEELEARVADSKLDVNKAFEIAIILESSEINDIYRNLTEPIEGPRHILRKKFDLSVGNHFERLESAARRFNASPDIQERLAKLSGRIPGEVVRR